MFFFLYIKICRDNNIHFKSLLSFFLDDFSKILHDDRAHIATAKRKRLRCLRLQCNALPDFFCITKKEEILFLKTKKRLVCEALAYKSNLLYNY